MDAIKVFLYMILMVFSLQELTGSTVSGVISFRSILLIGVAVWCLGNVLRMILSDDRESNHGQR